MVPAVRFRADIRAARRVVFLAGLLIPGLALAAAAADPALRPALTPWAAGEATPAPGLLSALQGVPA